jgi:hypothetical protein
LQRNPLLAPDREDTLLSRCVLRWCLLLLVPVLLLAGCDSSGRTTTSDPSPAGSTATPQQDPTVDENPLIQGLDVCSLVSPTQVRGVTDQIGEPSSRTLSRVPGYTGITDQCGFGVSFDSYTLTVDVGMAPTTARAVTRLPLKPVKGVAVKGIGNAALVTDTSSFSAVYFVKGRTFVRMQAFRGQSGESRASRLAALARKVAAKVPADPPASDDETSGVCAHLDTSAIHDLLGADPGVSRSFPYRDNSSMCSFASGVGPDARFVSVSTYTNSTAGPFFAEQEDYLPSKQVLGVSKGHAFTVPGSAYYIGDDGQAIGITGSLGGDPRKAAAPSQALTSLLDSAANLLQ